MHTSEVAQGSTTNKNRALHLHKTLTSLKLHLFAHPCAVSSFNSALKQSVFASLAEEKQFSKLDLAHAYQQIPLDEESRKLVVVNTHKGLFCYNRLPFGISSAPAIFQRTIEGILRGIPNVCVYLDDIHISGNSTEDHLKNLEAVMTKLEDAGMQLKVNKCAFLLDSVEYLGHKISAEELQPT